jgi:hypothetical protein
MLEIYCEEHLKKVREFARGVGALKQLDDKLNYLRDYGGGDNVCRLGYDFAPNSFEFIMCHPDGTRWFNGGLIYSGPTQPLDGSFPALTVSLDILNGPPKNTHDWSVHT